MEKRNFSLGKRALALALSLVMCVGMLQVTAFAEESTTPSTEAESPTTTKTETKTETAGPITTTESTGDENNGTSTTTTTTVVTTTETTVESTTKTEAETTKGEFYQVDEKPKVGTTVDTESKSEDISGLLNYEVTTETAHIKLSEDGVSDGQNSVKSDKVTAEKIAQDSMLACKDSKETVEDGKYTSSVTDEKKDEIKGEIKETGVTSAELPKETGSTRTENKGEWEKLPSSGSESEVLLPTRPEESTTTREDGTQQVISVTDIVEDGKTVGYTVTTEELDADGNVTSTKTEDQRGTKTVVVNAEEKKDVLEESKTTETTTKVEGVKTDTVVTETTTKTTEVNVAQDTLSVGQITIRPEGSKDKSDKIVATSADVSVKQKVEKGESSFTTNLSFTVKLEKTGLDYILTVFQGGKPVREQNVKVYSDTAIAIEGLALNTDNGSAEVKIELKPNDTSVEGIEGLDMTLQVEFKDIKGVQASAKQTEAFKKETETTTTKYAREDVETKTETTTTVTTTQVTKITDTDTVARNWSTTETPSDSTPTPDGTTTGGGTTGGTGDTPDTPPVVDVTDPDVPLVETPEVDVPEVEVPLVETPEVDVPDEEVPLAESPEEVEVLDEDVPLADVPKTGDISAMWYLTTLLSACGLGVLTLRKKDRS